MKAHIYLMVEGVAYPVDCPFTFLSTDGALHALDLHQTGDRVKRRKTRDATCGLRITGAPFTIANGASDDRVAVPWPPPASNRVGERCKGCFDNGPKRPDWTWKAWAPLIEVAS